MGLLDMILKAVDADYAASRTASYELGYRAREGLQQEHDYGSRRMVQERARGHNHRTSWTNDPRWWAPHGDDPQPGGWLW